MNLAGEYLRQARCILWDWNGTLLDDVSICINLINGMLTRRGHPAISRERYREIFTFPVKEYYKKAGFDLENEDFGQLAVEFIQGYHAAFPNAGLFKESRLLLLAFRNASLPQAILSAMEQGSLQYSLASHCIDSFFSVIQGIDNHHADGKLEAGRALMEKLTILPSDILLIGDTLHDAEVADALGVNCLLVASGHQSIHRLQQSGKTVVPGLASLLPLVQGQVIQDP